MSNSPHCQGAALWSFSTCFLKLSLVLTTFPHILQLVWVLIICLASTCLLTSLLLPVNPQSKQLTPPPSFATTNWSIALSSSEEAMPRSKGAIKTGKLATKKTTTKYCGFDSVLNTTFYFDILQTLNTSWHSCARSTCGYWRGPCCQSWDHTGDRWDRLARQSGPEYGSLPCPRTPWSSGKVDTSKSRQSSPAHCLDPARQHSPLWSLPQLQIVLY